MNNSYPLCISTLTYLDILIHMLRHKNVEEIEQEEIEKED